MRTRKAKCLLALVLMHPQGSENRERLASLLWDPAPEELARGSLRQALKELRGALGPMGEELVRADRFSISADPAAFDLDLRRLRALLDQGSVDAVMAAAGLWQGELFGALLPNAPVFEAWVQVERSHLRNLLTKALTDQLETQLAAQDFGDARIAEELVRIEPSHELAHQYLMRFHAMRGDQSAALRQFGVLERALEEELDSEPSAATTDLLVAIKMGDVGLDPAPRPPRPERRGPPRITIRPPQTRAFDASKDYLGEGFAHLARSCLSRFRAWVVIPWPASGFDGAGSVDYAALGRAVHADFAIDFVLDWRGPVARLFVTLVDCRDASEVWSQIYEVDERELQALSSTVAGRLAQNLAAQVNHITLLRQARNSLADPAAHDLWLRAHQLSRLWNPEADAEAEALLLQAIELDHGLASGHAVLAQILSTRNHVIPGYAGRQADLARAFQNAKRAVALDPYDPRCHISMAWNWLIQQSAERANSHFRLAVDLNPFDAEILISAADGMAFLGNMTEALDWAAQALELNPIHPEYYTGYLAGIQFLNGDYAKAVRTVEKCPDAIPYLAVWKAAALALMDDLPGARRAYGQFGDLIRAVWAGPSPPSDEDLQAWIIDTLPIWWPDGKARLERALHLARQGDLAVAAPV